MRSLTTALAALALFAAGCGDEQKAATKEPEADGGAKTACKAPATTDKPVLPATFPVPEDLQITAVGKLGPTNVVDGYWAADIDDVYPQYLDAVQQAGLDILFKEKEDNDAEISYKAGDRTGQIALRGDCSEDDTTRVHITNRPA